MEKVRVGVNGLGRIGRAFLKIAQQKEDIDIIAINDLGDVHNLAYLLKYDSAYGRSGLEVSATDGEASAIVVDGKEIRFLNERDPSKLPWGKMNIDVALEATGMFASFEKSRAHLDAGAKRVVISAPVEDTPPEGIKGATVLMGVNEDKLANCNISSNASCTTNAGGPLIQILHEKLGVERALLSTVHGYTTSQSLIDSPNKKDVRRGRAAAQNIVPSTTGAAIATTKAIPDLEGKFDGIAIRVPVIAGSLVDVTFVSARETSADEVNNILREAADDSRWQEVFTVTEEPLVSSDILGEPYASIADLSMTRVVGGTLVKVLSWYDNEMGYAHTLVNHVIKTGRYVRR